MTCKQIDVALVIPDLKSTSSIDCTWLTVVVAVGRYMVICHPLHARYLVSVTATRLAILAAFIVAVLMELATLWTFSVVSLVCPAADSNATVRYFVLDHGLLCLSE